MSYRVRDSARPVTAAGIAVVLQDFLDPHSVGPTYYGGHIFHGFGRMVEGDIVGGGGEVVQYGAEGAVEAGKWVLDQLF